LLCAVWRRGAHSRLCGGRRFKPVINDQEQDNEATFEILYEILIGMLMEKSEENVSESGDVPKRSKLFARA
jgi:hypothetical protein